MIAQLLLGLATIGAANRSAVYLGPPDEPRYRGHVQRIEVFIDSPQGGDRVAVRFHHAEGSFAFVAEGPAALSLLMAEPKPDLARYVFVSSGGRVLEFRHRRTGRAFAPYSFAIQPQAVLPACLDRHGQFQPKASFLWETFTRDEAFPAGAPPDPHAAAAVIALDDDLLVCGRATATITCPSRSN